MQNFNLERTRAPRRVIPWWVYAGAILFAGLLIWAAVKALPSAEKQSEAMEMPVEPAEPETAPAETAAVTPKAVPAATPQPVAVSMPTASRAPSAASAPAIAPGASSNPSPAPAGSVALRDAWAAKQQGDYRLARRLALDVLAASSNDAGRTDAESILNEVNIDLVLTPRDMDEKVEYVVAPGDSLEKIAKKFNTTVDLVRKSNDIKGSLIRAGDRLRILQGTFSVAVSKSANDLVLSLDGKFFKRYRVGTGQYNKTPVGDFVINDRIAQPTWWRPDGKSIPFGDPENLLGTHWLSINVKGYGLHGTWEPDTIGKQLSAGCVRLLNEDIEQLYTLLPLGTPVSIRD